MNAVDRIFTIGERLQGLFEAVARLPHSSLAQNVVDSVTKDPALRVNDIFASVLATGDTTPSSLEAVSGLHTYEVQSAASKPGGCYPNRSVRSRVPMGNSTSPMAGSPEREDNHLPENVTQLAENSLLPIPRMLSHPSHPQPLTGPHSWPTDREAPITNRIPPPKEDRREPVQMERPIQEPQDNEDLASDYGVDSASTTNPIPLEQAKLRPQRDSDWNSNSGSDRLLFAEPPTRSALQPKAISAKPNNDPIETDSIQLAKGGGQLLALLKSHLSPSQNAVIGEENANHPESAAPASGDGNLHDDQSGPAVPFGEGSTIGLPKMMARQPASHSLDIDDLLQQLGEHLEFEFMRTYGVPGDS